MTDKSRKYAFAAGILFLISFISSLYSYVLNRLYTSKYVKKSIFEVWKSIFKDEGSRNAEIFTLGLIVVTLFLFIAMFSENRGLFIVAVILAAGLYGFRMYYWITTTSKLKNWDWNSSKTFSFIYSCVLTGVVLLMMLFMAISLAASSGMTGAFALVSYLFSGIITGIAAAIDIIPLFSDEFQSTEWSTNLSRFKASNMDGFLQVIAMDFIVILVCRWASLKREALTAAKNKTTPIDESQQPQAAVAPFFQAQQPTYQNTRPIYAAPVQPAQASVQQVPVQPAPAQAPSQPTTPPPAGTVFAAQAPKTEAPAPVDEVKEALKASGPSAEEIEAAYEKISNTTDLSSEVSYTAENLSDDMAAKLARLSEEAAKEVASGKEDDLSDALERIGEKAEKAADDAAEVAEDAAESVETAAADVADAVEDEAAEAVEDVMDDVKDAVTEAVADVTDDVTEAAAEVADDAEKVVSEAVESVTEAAGDAEAAAEEAVESAENLTEDIIKNE